MSAGSSRAVSPQNCVSIFERLESNVRSYCRAFPTTFTTAKGAVLRAEDGKEYIDFLSGAGALSYGHNNDEIKNKIISYLSADGISHALDLYTSTKKEYLQSFDEIVLKPRNLRYKVQFCGPTGTNGVEAALKLSRIVTGRSGIFAFMGGYHGMSLGSLAATGNRFYRVGAGTPLGQVTFFPYGDTHSVQFDSIDYMASVLEDSHSGTEVPAAIIVETVQAEGGVYVAPIPWLRRLSELADKHGILLICDDVQVGCGRTGSFFSFERAGIVPDMVVLSKAISGYGLPMALLLIKPELDAWQPGQHSGTFRGNQLAFVGGAAALEYMRDHDILRAASDTGAFIHDYLREEIEPISPQIRVRGIGMIWGIDVADLGGPELAKAISKRCFELGLILECVGRQETVLKIIPPLNTERALLERGCSMIGQALLDALPTATKKAAPKEVPKRQAGRTLQGGPVQT